MPLAKNAPEPIPQTQPSQATRLPDPVSVAPQIDGIPMEVYRYFNINPMENQDRYTTKQIKDIYGWANQENKGMGDAIWKIRSIENKLGVPAIGETRHTKIYNWVRISGIVNNLEKERTQQLGLARRKRQLEREWTEKEHQKKVAEIEKKKRDEEKLIRKQHEGTLKQFQKIRKAYEVNK